MVDVSKIEVGDWIEWERSAVCGLDAGEGEVVKIDTRWHLRPSFRALDKARLPGDHPWAVPASAVTAHYSRDGYARGAPADPPCEPGPDGRKVAPVAAPAEPEPEPELPKAGEAWSAGDRDPYTGGVDRDALLREWLPKRPKRFGGRGWKRAVCAAISCEREDGQKFGTPISNLQAALAQVRALKIMRAATHWRYAHLYLSDPGTCPPHEGRAIGSGGRSTPWDPYDE